MNPRLIHKEALERFDTAKRTLERGLYDLTPGSSYMDTLVKSSAQDPVTLAKNETLRQGRRHARGLQETCRGFLEMANTTFEETKRCHEAREWKLSSARRGFGE